MNLDEKIRKIRKENKMSQDDLAEVLNVTRPNNIKLGKWKKLSRYRNTYKNKR